MQIHYLFVPILIICILSIGYLIKSKPDSAKLYAILGIVVITSILTLYIHGIVKTMNHVSYKKIEEIDIFFNEADQNYYFSHNGSIISLHKACSKQYRSKVPPSRIKEIPKVTVYEKKYLPILGIYYGQKKNVYVHGFDARINQQIELK